MLALSKQLILSPFARADLLRGSHGLAVPSHQGAPTVSLQRQHRRQRCALSLRRYTWARDARADGIGLGHEARHRARGQRGRSDLDSAQAAARPTYDTIIGLFIIEVMLQRLKKDRIRAGRFAILFNASWVFLISSSLLVAWCAFNSCDFK